MTNVTDTKLTEILAGAVDGGVATKAATPKTALERMRLAHDAVDKGDLNTALDLITDIGKNSNGDTAEVRLSVNKLVNRIQETICTAANLPAPKVAGPKPGVRY